MLLRLFPAILLDLRTAPYLPCHASGDFMDWFQQLRAALAASYPPVGPQDIVGYLRGSANPKDWRSMIERGREQMIILGSTPPTDEEWAAAGVAQRGGGVQTIRFDDLRTFIITYGGFMLTRPWGKISTLTADTFRNYGTVTIPQFKANLPRAAAKNAALIAAMSDVISRIEANANTTSGEHKIQQELVTGAQGNFTGFWGYWTNHLFNSDVPPLAIWNQCFAEIAHARSTLKEGKFAESGRTIVRARAELLKATGVYYRWKSGIDGAGVKMQAAIGAVAVTLIFAAVAATVAAAGTAGAAAAGAEGASATTSIEAATSALTKADTILARVVATAPGGATAPSVVLYEQALEEAGEATEELFEMLR